MRKGSKKYRIMLNELMQEGVFAHIIRIDTRRYEVHVDFEVRKQYRQRQSANAYIRRLYQQTTGSKEV